MNAALSVALDGIDVVALVTNVPGPVAAARLRALGARILKVEPLRGDPLQAAAPQWYAALTADLTVERVDLRDAEACAAIRSRIDRADVLLTAARAGALERVGLGWAALHARAPRLLHVAVVGEGAPHDDRAGHDLTYQARAGLLDPPALPRTLIADLGAAERAVTATLAGLLARARTGVGARIEVAIVDAARDAAAPLRYGLTAPGDALGGGFDGYALYRARDGWIAFAALEAHFAERACTVLDVERLERAALVRAFAQRTVREWEGLAERYDLPLAAVAGAGGG